MSRTTERDRWRSWQESWDRQQEWYLPDREERFRVMLDTLEALAGPAPRVLDLACGTGSITGRVLRRLPEARVTALDLDPALLTIARGSYAEDERVEFVTADLTTADWPERLPHPSYDAVLTATALHWLTTEPLRALYGRIAGLLPEGGVLMNADHMPDESTPRINAAVRAFDERRRERDRAAGRQSWSDWWEAVAADPELAGVAAERFALFGDPAHGDHNNNDFQPPAWHAQTLREVGFAEARPIWCSSTDALVLALR
ncbi:class I SAM-dependent methyltransferase [Streptomyces sp. AJS327]|uniref:class I SAM-dependent methyltransferase n=1 Tax=Streptomyces sp. AJS327 TaxID=2545265 RepID=UPI0015DFD00B|nr:class I SAM-dependent methyltransferase [Streptomyces sp. AJS327]MBA0051532.1 class I SAM-dependent methyltransferase [Streptomyces sp. AJS327]